MAARLEDGHTPTGRILDGLRWPDAAVTGVRLDTGGLGGVRFIQRGGIDGFLRTFGEDHAGALLDELDRDLTA